MNELDTKRLKADHADEIAELRDYHAREVAAIRTTHFNQLGGFKEQFALETKRLKNQITTLEEEIVRLQHIIVGVERALNGLPARQSAAQPNAEKLRRRLRQ